MTEANPLTRQQAWDRIPWLINGTLDAEEAAAVEAHISSCPLFRAEFEHQQRVNEAVKELEAPIPDQALALEAISHRLSRQKTAFSLADWFRSIAHRVTAPSGLALSGAVAAVAVLLVVSLSLMEPRFETLSTPDPSVDGVEIRLRFQSEIDAAEIAELMRMTGATNIIGPSETGLMRGTVAEDVATDVVARLKSDPRVLFVAKDD